MYLIGAATRGIALDSVNVRMEAENNDAALLGLATADPPMPFNIRAFVRVDSTAPEADIAALHAYVEEACPLTKIIREPNAVTVSTNSQP
jgi:organic hydroperoxide reductase OsmC/OhrA